MPYRRVIPHSDGAGIVDAVGPGVDPGRIGRRVWLYGAQSYRPFGTAAEFTVVPTEQAVDLPDEVSDEIGACLGIPGITAHRAVFADGPVTGQTVLVHGVLGGVGALAAQLARWGGAIVVGTVRRSASVDEVDTAIVSELVALDQPDPAAAIAERAQEGVDRIIEVAFSDNVDLDAAVAKTTQSSPHTRRARTALTSRSGRCCSNIARFTLSGRGYLPSLIRTHIGKTERPAACADGRLRGHANRRQMCAVSRVVWPYITHR